MSDTDQSTENPATPQPPTFGEKLKTARKLAGATQAKAAELAGMSQWTILSWEQGRSTPHPQKQRAVLKKLDEIANPPQEPSGVTDIGVVEMEEAPVNAVVGSLITPADLARIIEKAQEYDPEQRFAASIYASQEPQPPMILTDPPATMTATIPAAAVAVQQEQRTGPRFGLPV